MENAKANSKPKSSGKWLKRGTIVALGAVALTTVAIAAPSGSKNNAQPQAIEQLDLARYSGTWYEIARFPMYFQRKCASDVTATYGTLSNGNVSVLNKCRQADGSMMASTGEASAVNSTNTKLKVSFLPQGLRWIPFTKGDYWVLKLDENYQTALVGGPNRKYLWILSRTPNLDEKTYQAYVAAAKQQGFDVSKLERTIHTQQK